MCKEKKYINNQTGEELDWNKVKALPDNAMLKVKPELWCEWDFEKNNELGKDIWEMTKGKHDEVWWYCDKYVQSYPQAVRNKNKSCKICCGQYIIGEISLFSLNPKLASEWHSTLNDGLTPNDVTCGSSKKVWWQCELGHEWDAIVAQRSRGDNCPYCSNHRVLKGFNDIWTTNPELASLLADPEDGYRYSQSSDKRVNCKCPECEEVVRNKKISNVKKRGLSCPKCSDGISYPEKFTYNLLSQLGINFKFQEMFEWSNKKRYDFYIPSHKAIIEVHGIQHYIQTNRKNSRTIAEEQVNDKNKYEIAMENGTDKYIVIDARESDISWIKNSIVNSELGKLYDLNTINWTEVYEKSIKSLIRVVCDLWNNGLRNTGEISDRVKLHRGTVIRYLKQGSEIGWCDYCPKESLVMNATKRGRKNKKSLIQLSLNGSYLKEWRSAKEVMVKLSVHNSSISACCRGRVKSTGGFKWMYKEDYEKYIEEQKQLA